MNIDNIITSLHLESWITYSLVILSCIVIGLMLRWILFSLIKFSNKRKPTVLKAQLLKHLKAPAIFLLPILFMTSLISNLI